MLHSSMQSGDQRRVFGRASHGKRKVPLFELVAVSLKLNFEICAQVVLSTNLAETSITIDDIVYVIDTGKVKVKTYDTLSGVSALKAEWISQVKDHRR